MKRKYFIPVLTLSMLIFNSCGDSGKKGNEDSLKGPDGKTAFVLDKLLDIKNESELKTKYGADHVTYDTVWGAEGMYAMGSYIDKGMPDEVIVMWGDSASRSEVISASINAMNVTVPDKIFDGKWISSTGIKLGMTTGDLEKLNEKSFIFSGFGWDYGGGVIDWREGKLDKRGIGVQLSEGPGANSLNEKEALEILGDIEVMSDNAVVKKVQPRVVRVSVFKPE